MVMIERPDAMVTALRGLAAAPPSGLGDKLFGNWSIAPSRLGEMFVVGTRAGVQFVRSVESMHSDEAAFAEAYRVRFGRPLRPTDRAPGGLLAALAGRPGGAVQLDLSGSSEFEKAVLAATRRIPNGQTRPYAWVAREAGRPRAVRAVGTVLARNPVPLLVPCHRVVRADGGLGQYMFGPAQKEQLLRAEGANLDEVAELAAHGVHYLGSDTTGVVCLPTCRDARRITAPHRHGFRTFADATAAGYRPCLHCRPGADAVPA